MEELRATLRQIESDLDNGTYQPGPWAAFVSRVTQRPAHERAALTTDINRVSNKLHRRRRRYTMSFPLAILLELVSTVIGVLLLRLGLRRNSTIAAGTAATILSMTSQPLLKTFVGQVAGVGYSYAYVEGMEPHFKMRYGNYLAAPRWKRVLVQFSGIIGTPVSLYIVSSITALRLPFTSKLCKVLFWFFSILQVVFLALGLAGVKRVGSVYVVRSTSGGAAGAEIRDGFVD